MERESLLEKTIMFEIDGKNQAIHEYDKMLWNLRIGYLTLFFAACGLLIKSVIDNNSTCQISHIFYLIAIFAVFIAAGAFAVDANYSKRKYKVIRVMNLIYKVISEKVKNGVPDPEDFRVLLIISGTTSIPSESNYDLDCLKDTGYLREIIVSILIYFLPLIIILIGFIFWS